MNYLHARQSDYDKCILVHCDNNHIIRFDDLKELDRYINKLLIVKDQIFKELEKEVM